jgi:drug/metabolite transporter (DMT)-like permease
VGVLLATAGAPYVAEPPLIFLGGYELMTRPIGTITPVVVGLLFVGTVASVAAFLCWNGGIRGAGAAAVFF